MKAFGTRLEVVSAMVPAGGWMSALLPVLALVGLAAAVGDYGVPGLEKAIVGLGMFAAGVLKARSLPVWREATEDELARHQLLRESSPAAPWLCLAKTIGWPGAIVVFAALCAILAAVGLAAQR